MNLKLKQLFLLILLLLISQLVFAGQPSGVGNSVYTTDDLIDFLIIISEVSLYCFGFMTGILLATLLPY
jgi:hypothetical protein